MVLIKYLSCVNTKCCMKSTDSTTRFVNIQDGNPNRAMCITLETY